MMSDVVTPDYIEDAARVQEDHYREVAARLRLMADIEPLASLRRHLRQLAAQHDEVAAGLEEPQSDEAGAPGVALG